MENLNLLFVLGFVVLAGYFMLRPIVGMILPRSKDRSKGGLFPGELSGSQATALEVAALVSLMIAFPYGLFGYSSITLVFAFAVGLAFLPVVARPAIALLLLVFAVTELDPATSFNLFLVIGSFLLLRVAFRFARRMFGSS